MPWFVRLWRAKEDRDRILLHELLRIHQSQLAASQSVSESLVYREHSVGRELLDLVLYRDERATRHDEHRRLLDLFERIGAAHALSCPRSHRLEVIQEFATGPERGLYGMAAVLRSRTSQGPRLTEALQALASGVVGRLSPTRVLIGRATADPGLLFFLGDSRFRIDLGRYLKSPLYQQHRAALGPLLVSPTRFYTFDPLWRYVRIAAAESGVPRGEARPGR